jgi:hypothetical protein
LPPVESGLVTGERRNNSTKNGPEMLALGLFRTPRCGSEWRRVIEQKEKPRRAAIHIDAFRFRYSAPGRRTHIEKSDCEERVIN